MNSQRIFSQYPQRRRPTIPQVVLLASLFALCVVGIISSAAQSTQDNTAAPAEERELKDTIPKHLPIKVKIKKEKEKAFKDLKNEKWVRDFELEVTNTGDKPIYFLSLALSLPEITAPFMIAPDGNKMGFSLHYGRRELVDIETKAGPDDIPIKPGETYVFRFSDLTVQSWERFRQRESKPDAKKLILHFQILSFGDGTGFVSTGGIPIPNPSNKRSSLDRCGPGQDFGDPGGVKVQQISGSQPTVFSTDVLPASFLLAKIGSDTERRSKMRKALRWVVGPGTCFSFARLDVS